MDGVLADFDQRFEDISGMKPKEFEDKYGTKAFWNLIDEENKISFWVGIKPMPGAADLIKAVKKYKKHAEGTISYTTSPVHNIEYFVTFYFIFILIFSFLFNFQIETLARWVDGPPSLWPPLWGG